jgi:hypothetical protein
MTGSCRDILAALAVALTLAGTTTVTAVAALSATDTHAALVNLFKDLKDGGALSNRELRRVPNEEDKDDDDDDDDDDHSA